MAPVTLGETLGRTGADGDSHGGGDHGLARVARLVRILNFDRLEAGGGPAVALDAPFAELGRGEADRVLRDPQGMAVEVVDPLMSRRHARLVAVEGGHAIEDLGSRNGTLVDGHLAKRAPLRDGQILETGRTAWMYRLAPAGVPLHADVGPTRSYSPAIVRVWAQLATLAPAAVSLLITGETGTGKEIFAREVHARSGRRGSFVAVNCGALTDTLLESELFGHRKGAFTGAVADRAGHVEAADGGTLFLDEIGEMPAPAQVRLLRVLQEGEVVPVGGTAPRKVDVRVVAATHRDLVSMVEARAFREDLYARLEGWVLALPRLADRREDLGELVAHAVRAAGAARAQATARAARALLGFDWPFNVRQLMKTMEAAVALSQGGPIDLEHLPPRMLAPAPGRRSEPPADLEPADLELRQRIVDALRAHGGNVTHAAQALGKQRQQMQRWMRRFGLDASDFGGSDPGER